MSRICFVLCYIGPLPRYFLTFLATCARNESVDFLIASDQPAPDSLGANVRWTHATLASLRDRFSGAVGFPVSLSNGYKLCDYKPVLGQAFADGLRGYDFWGFCDPDLVWGHIRSFATEERLAAHDVLTFRGRDFISGPCTLIRNEPALNTLYAESPDLERAFQMPEIAKFTEWGGGTRERRTLDEIVAAERLVSFTDVVRWAVESGRVRWFDEDVIVERSTRRYKLLFEWRRGHLYQVSENGRPLDGQDGKEILFYHYVAAKDDPWFYIPERSALPESFRITERGAFVPHANHIAERLSFETKRIMSGAPRSVRRLTQRVRSRLVRAGRSSEHDYTVAD